MLQLLLIVSDLGTALRKALAEHPHFRDHMYIVLPFGHLFFGVLRMMAAMGWALGVNRLAQRTIFTSDAGQYSLLRCTNIRRGLNLHLSQAPHAVAVALIYSVAKAVLKNTPEKAGETATGEAVLAYVDGHKDDAGLEYLVHFFISGSLAHAKLFFVGTRLRNPAMVTGALKKMTNLLFARGLVNYSREVVKFFADLERMPRPVRRFVRGSLISAPTKNGVGKAAEMHGELSVKRVMGHWSTSGLFSQLQTAVMLAREKAATVDEAVERCLGVAGPPKSEGKPPKDDRPEIRAMMFDIIDTNALDYRPNGEMRDLFNVAVHATAGDVQLKNAAEVDNVGQLSKDAAVAAYWVEKPPLLIQSLPFHARNNLLKFSRDGEEEVVPDAEGPTPEQTSIIKKIAAKEAVAKAAAAAAAAAAASSS
jgi:hypothetical protein